MGTIYAIVSEVSGKVYIGQTKMEPAEKRWKAHITTFKTLLRIGEHRHQNWTKVYRAFQSYGVESFRFVKLVDVANEDLTIYENYYIGLFDSVSCGYNITKDNRPPRYTELSADQKQRHSDGLKKAWTNTDCFFNSQEYKELLSVGMKAAWSNPNSKMRSEERLNKISVSLKGHSVSESTRAKISTSLQNNTRSRKRVLINGAVYTSCTIAAEALGVSNVTITSWLKSGKAFHLPKD